MKKLLGFLSLFLCCNILMSAMESDNTPKAPAEKTADECAICFDSFDDLQENRVPNSAFHLPPKQKATMPCGHQFHRACIKEYRDTLLEEQALRNSIPCPYCRADVPVNPNSPRVKQIRFKHGLKVVLRSAVCTGNREEVRSLVDRGADLTARYDNNLTLLHLAVLHQQAEMVDFLLSFPAVVAECLNVQTLGDVDVPVGDSYCRVDRGWTPLHCAVRLNSVEMITKLIGVEAQANLKDKYGNTPLLLAAKNNHSILACDALLGLDDVDCSIADRLGMTTLMAIAEKQPGDVFLHVMSLILERRPVSIHDRIVGADINLGFACLSSPVNIFNGATALHIAAAYGHVKYIEMLLDAGADINAADEKGLTPLMMAVAWDRFDAVSFLLSRGARVGCALLQETIIENDKGTFLPGSTALHIAAARSSFEIIASLSSKEANHYRIDVNGNRPFDIAQQIGRSDRTQDFLRFVRACRNN
jgi:ankyrin repeat protein